MVGGLWAGGGDGEVNVVMMIGKKWAKLYFTGRQLQGEFQYIPIETIPDILCKILTALEEFKGRKLQ